MGSLRVVFLGTESLQHAGCQQEKCHTLSAHTYRASLDMVRVHTPPELRTEVEARTEIMVTERDHLIEVLTRAVAIQGQDEIEALITMRCVGVAGIAVVDGAANAVMGAAEIAVVDAAEIVVVSVAEIVVVDAAVGAAASAV